MGPLVRELLARLFELGQFLEFALHGRYSLSFILHTSLESFQPFLGAFFLFLAGLLSAQLALLRYFISPSRMARLRRQRVVSVESIVVVVRERGASGMSRAGVEALGLLRRDVW